MNPREEWHLNTARLGRRVLIFDRLDSTNSFALSLAADRANDGLVILADEQTAGRGQHGRTWTCPDGGGVLMSVLLFPPAALQRPAILTAWAAVTVCELILETTGIQAQLKWPNDVLIADRKVCGILIEQAGGVVAGIGLNVSQAAEHFTAAGLTQGASLAMFAGRDLSCRPLARRLIELLDGEYCSLDQGNLGPLEARWRQRFGLLGKTVQVETAGQALTGRLLNLTFDGLELAVENQGIRRLLPETVKHIRG
jgi:BirA family biotin operon repressor/biotin-[acetyl-CoA-carboxylase] ligase